MSDPTAAAPAAAPTTAAAPTAPAATAPAASPAAPAIPWMADVSDPELIGHAQNAGWQSPADAVKSHRELQKLFGADRHGRTIVMPKDDATPAELADFYTKLGRPETPDGYKLPVPEGGDPAFAKQASAWFHELGIPGKAAQALTAKFNEHAASVVAAQAEAEQAALQAEHDALNKDWGSEAPMRRELAKRAGEKLGLGEAAINALEKAAGFSGTMKALARMGDLLREGGAVGLDEIGSFGRTREGAMARKSQLLADKEWRAKAMNPNSREWAEMQQLDSIIAA